MFDKLDDILIRLEEVLNQLSERKGKRYEENSTCDHGSRNRQQIGKGNQAA